MTSLNINQGMIIKALPGKGKTNFVLMLPDQSSRIYITDYISNQAMHNPAKFIEETSLKPLYILSWSHSVNMGKGGAVLESCDSEGLPKIGGLSDNDIEMTGKVLAVVNRQIKTVFDLFTFLSHESVLLVAKNYLIQMFNLSDSDASAFAPTLVSDWLEKGRQKLAKILSDDPDLTDIPSEYLKSALEIISDLPATVGPAKELPATAEDKPKTARKSRAKVATK